MKTLDQFLKSSETVILEKKRLNKIVGGNADYETAKTAINNLKA